ncbi:hypothetical protein [uncultured Methanolobus sp.]|uniref:hypothetical protein n=1 Tax=uncultured Methanolobus sp. TaxID=218300 RepID=UPI003747BE5D
MQILPIVFFFDSIKCVDGGIVEVTIGNLHGSFNEEEMRYLMDGFFEARYYIRNGAKIPADKM